MAPLVSFIIPCYNLPLNLLEECICSIEALSLRPAEREIILIDDGSQVSPIEALKDRFPTILYLRQPNAGLSAARNRGLQMATGTYIQFIDGDDLLLQAPYEHCLDLVRYQKPDMVMFDSTDKREVTLRFTDEGPISGTAYMQHHNLHASAWGYLFKRSMIGELRFTRGMLHEDEEFTPLLILRVETLYKTSAQAYYYRRRQGSIIHSTERRQVIQRLTDKKRAILSLNDRLDTLPPSERKALQRRIAQLTMDYIYNIIVETQSRHYLDRKLEALRKDGLFPLPDRSYTTKYRWFRRMTNSRSGLNILMRVLPTLKKEYA